MFEAEIFGLDVNVQHLVLAVVGLALVTTYVLDRATRLKPIATAVISILITQALAGLLLVLLLSKSAQPVRDAQSWIAHYLAYFNVVVFWFLCPVFAAPVAILVTMLSKRGKSAEE
ncbi:hypothetical protein [Bradyrhizobium iriomotense]|uniref:hypothetical protein n=1 Tax=Bradyrhizobium iriomotense TaxID=441950 RepID=UPI001B89DD35|nr:hypothetical protein [Bradyrhizobium iriomotense]MBR0781078.1 hypothetical protein [Bradyrhizobium iriomotense]